MISGGKRHAFLLKDLFLERPRLLSLQLDFLGDILSTFTIALLTPARGGNRCDSVCSAVHRLTIPLELVSNQPSLSL
jgi:hypothetical protein